ncbi:MAG: hypothetical protein IH811_01150 [Proteobacteria bacterium]|nr:hypothetical protein [Pseudomonadota bacterium]
MKVHNMYPGIILFLTLMSANVNAALTIEVTQGVEGALPIAVVPFDTSRLETELPADIAEIVANDLNRSGIFKTMDRQKLPAQPHYSTQVIYPKWRTAGQEYLVVGRIFQKSSGQYDIQFQLLDVLKLMHDGVKRCAGVHDVDRARHVDAVAYREGLAAYGVDVLDIADLVELNVWEDAVNGPFEILWKLLPRVWIAELYTRGQILFYQGLERGHLDHDRRKNGHKV